MNESIETSVPREPHQNPGDRETSNRQRRQREYEHETPPDDYYARQVSMNAIASQATS
jgi:hypothetical protein